MNGNDLILPTVHAPPRRPRLAVVAAVPAGEITALREVRLCTGTVLHDGPGDACRQQALLHAEDGPRRSDD